MTTLQQRTLFELTSENKRRTDGASAVAVTGNFRVIVLGWVAGSLWENLVHLFYYYTTYYYVRMIIGTVLNCTGHEVLDLVRVMS